MNNDDRDKLQEFENKSNFFQVHFPWVLKDHEPMNTLFLQWAEACRTLRRTEDNRHSPASGGTF
jgi:hypothetical protein